MSATGLPQGHDIGGYVVLGRLGSGGSGTVYKVRDAEGRIAALKLLDAADEVSRERLGREVKALMAVRHDAVPRIIDAELDDVRPFVVFEFVEGLSLADHVHTHGPLAGDQLAHLASRLLGALETAHAQGIIHRDVTPSNVMLSPHGGVLIDFGLSQTSEDSRLTKEGLVSGTAGYVAPEVIDGGDPDAGADLWSWAATLAFAMTGKAPFGVGGSAIRSTLEAKWPAPRVAGGPQLAAFLCRRPRKRPEARAVVAALAGSTEVIEALHAADEVAKTRLWRPRAQQPPLAATAMMPSAQAGGQDFSDDDFTDEDYTDDGYVNDDYTDEDYDDAGLGDGYRGGQGDEPWDQRRHSPWSAELVLPSSAAFGALKMGRKRPGLVAAVTLAGASVGAVAPLVGALLVILVALTSRTVFNRADALERARAKAGERKRDAVLHTVGIPWHALRATVTVFPAILIAALAGSGLVAVGFWLVGEGVFGAPNAEVTARGKAVALALGVLLGAGVVWRGPFSWGTRVGAYRIVEALAPTRAVSLAWMVVALAVIVSAALALSLGVPTWWWPFPPRP